MVLVVMEEEFVILFGCLFVLMFNCSAWVLLAGIMIFSAVKDVHHSMYGNIRYRLAVMYHCSGSCSEDE